jgi:2-keto-4-pentenoate hydratase/2-oxohepta-3-ene-1,7-dioic acid hydratase in catechol pathway
MREMEGRMGPTKGKSFDTGNAIGPWIVTADETEKIKSLQC